MKHSKAIICALTLMSFLAGCERQLPVESAKEANYNVMPKSIFMIYPQGPRTKFYGPNFDQNLKKYVTSCGIKYASDYETKASDTLKSLTLNDMRATAVTASKYDWALQISVYKDHYEQVTSYGTPIGTPTHTGVTYNYTLTDMAKKEKVWRANIFTDLKTGIFAEENNFGKRMALALIKAMRADGLLTSCGEISP